MAARTWISDSTKNWSDATAWDGGVAVPTSGDTVTFNSTHVGNCTANAFGTFNGSITVSSYTGTITQSAALSGVGAFSIAAGTWNRSTFGFDIGSNTFACTGTGIFTGTSGTMTTGAVTFSNTANLTATSGTWNLGGSWTTSNTPTFSANGGTINITAASTFAPAVTLNLVTINSSGAVTISSGTTCPLGATPTSTVGSANSLTVSGALTYSGTWTHTGNIVAAASSTVTGSSSPAIILAQAGTLNISATVTGWTSVNVTYNGTGGGNTYVDTGAKNTGTWTINAGVGVVVAASTTMALGSNPTVNISTSTMTVTGAVTFSGTWTHTGALTATGTITGTSTPVIVIIESAANFTSVTFTNPLSVTMNQTSATSRTFTGGAKTYTTFTRTGSGSGTLIIASSNTFTTFRDSAAGAAHTLQFTAGTTQTATTFDLNGASGKLLTINSSSAGSAATLHTTGSEAITATFASIKDSTVDAAPQWFYGEGSSVVSGNTNWLAGASTGSAAFAIILRRRRR